MPEDFIDAEGYDPENPQPFSSRQFRKSRQETAEEDVEYSSIPRVDDMEGYNRATHMFDMIRLEPDIFEWLLAGGLDYERRANGILRRQMILEKGLIPPDVL